MTERKKKNCLTTDFMTENVCIYMYIEHGLL